MLSDKKRINLTVPDDLYQQIRAYRDERGIFSDSSACLQLINQALKEAL